MSELDLTPFGFTPTESRVYQVLLGDGPGTGYAIARSAGLARANAYSALEGLVTKGAARAEDGQPKRFRAEPPAGVLARIANAQGEALERLSRALDGFGAPATPSVVELTSPKGLLQLLTHEIGRCRQSVRLIAPAEAFPILGPALRRAATAGLEVILAAQVPVQLPFVRVDAIPSGFDWPGLPLVAVLDGGSAVIGARGQGDVLGHWSSAPSFVAAARIIFERLRTGS
jgi:HTH-type transcriptional regulator, sugar sensing transcriptional regulator